MTEVALRYRPTCVAMTKKEVLKTLLGKRLTQGAPTYGLLQLVYNQIDT